MDDTIQLRTIGVVRRDGGDGADGQAVLAVQPELRPALLGIEPGMRLQVMYWMHRLSDEHRRVLQCHPRGDRSRPLRGVFALRSPMRPNMIGSTEVDVKAVRGTEVVVTGLDAFDGSPIVDIKIAPRR